MPKHGKSTAVLVNSANLSAFFDSASVSRSCETAETTTFGSDSRTYIPGVHDGTVSVSGLFDGALAATDVTLSAVLGSGAAVTVLLEGPTFVPGRVKICSALQTSYDVTNSVSDKVAVAAEFQGNGGVWGGDLLIGLSPLTATGMGTVVDSGLTSGTADGWAASLHIPILPTGTTPTATYKIQDSADGTTFADLAGGTFPVVSTTGAIYLTGFGTVRRYLRASYTIAGTTPSFTAALALARK